MTKGGHAHETAVIPPCSGLCPAANQPQVRRYTHPIERSAQRAPRCEALQTVLCALAGQNQVLCAIKAELDEVLALLEQQKTEPADRGGSP